MSRLKSELNNVISKSLMIGQSKREYKEKHRGSTEGKIFGIQTTETLRATANQFSKWAERKYPDLKIRKITAEIVNEWFKEHEKTWSRKTALDKASDMRNIMARAERIYHKCKFDPRALQEIAGYTEKVRDKAMTGEDIKKIRDSFTARGSRSEARTALELSARLGMRVNECVDYRNRGSCIDIVNRKVHIVGKNGKWRDVPIRPADIGFMTELKERIGPDGRFCGNTRAESMSRAIRREMERVGISKEYERTTNHAIRKFYARERMNEEREKGLSERNAWEIVQKELGHGDKFRQVLYDVYIGQ
ncbi:MAG: site-specific integrase [Lachnospiraceae bacterium]|nr:site-specific integrase [Lachnospiraceae bacterium]